MNSEATILPLDIDETICALQDEKGNIIGTGSREICEVLLHIISKQSSKKLASKSRVTIQPRANVRAAIRI
jgi:hypothetical protein